MKLLYHNETDKLGAFIGYVNDNICGDYIYDYPPRQAYRPINPDDAMVQIKNSLEKSDELNLYFHFPFCKQICSYCNLFSICETNGERFEEYFEELKKEVLFYKPYIQGKRINSVYLGGGTPSMIEAPLFKDFFDFIESEIGFSIRTVSEVAIEMSPDCAEPHYLSELVNIGINRINIGVQAANDNELSCIGRNYTSELLHNSLTSVMNAGFKNVCVDLIYGLENQSFQMWKDSVKAVASYEPPTICAYPLTLRSNTGFARRGYVEINGKVQYAKYEFARDYLLAHGYIQETHVRYKKENSHGGYIQKENHWKQQNILGFGAGARSYLKTINVRNGYSIVNRRKAYNQYLSNIRIRGHAITDGFLLSADERMRKLIVLGIDGLDLSVFPKQFGLYFEEHFEAEYKYLLQEGYMMRCGNSIRFTTKGSQYRDLIVQLFFSDYVNQTIADFSYNE